MSNIINVYFLNVDFLKDKAIFKKEYNNVLPYRKNKIDALQFEKDKILSLGAEILLQKACLVNNISYKEIEVILNEFGKPFIKNNPFFYSVSHSGSLVMLATAPIELGCDIEYMHDYDINLAKRFYTDDEYQNIIHSLNEKEEFFKTWTKKESYVKSEGQGLKIALNSFSSLKETISSKIIYSEIKDEYCLAISIKSFEEFYIHFN